MIISQLQRKYDTLNTLDLDLLIAHTIHKDKEFIYSHPEYKLSFFEKISLSYLVYLHNKGYSVAALIGHKEFYGLDFFMNKKVLMPRPETELMVEEVLGIMNNELKIKGSKIILIDVGTGSGCIPISILKNIKDPIQAFAIDISKPALKVAKKNAKKYNTNIQFLHGNLLEPIIPRLGGVGVGWCRFFNQRPPIIEPTPGLKASPAQAGIIITANLPYLTEQQFQFEKSIQKEPKLALVADKNGLALYEELLKQIKCLVSHRREAGSRYGGKISNPKLLVSVFLEIDPSQTEAISKFIEQTLPKTIFEIKKDLAGFNRLVIIQITSF